MVSYQELYEFVDRAKRNRKYPEATAQALKAALKLYDSELSEDEKASLSKIKSDFEQITQSVFSKNAKDFSASSLATYKSRLLKVIADFEKYGDPAKMNNWIPKVITRVRKVNQQGSPSQKNNADLDIGGPEAAPEQSHIFSDRGSGWSLVTRSRSPVTSEIKKRIVDIADLLSDINKTSDDERV